MRIGLVVWLLIGSAVAQPQLVVDTQRAPNGVWTFDLMIDDYGPCDLFTAARFNAEPFDARGEWVYAFDPNYSVSLVSRPDLADADFGLPATTFLSVTHPNRERLWFGPRAVPAFAGGWFSEAGSVAPDRLNAAFYDPNFFRPLRGEAAFARLALRHELPNAMYAVADTQPRNPLDEMVADANMLVSTLTCDPPGLTVNPFEVTIWAATDCNNNGVLDEFEHPSADPALGDCDGNLIADGCDDDCDQDGVPDACEDDCSGNGIPDDCENDCDNNGVPDDCDPDCDGDGIPDACQGHDACAADAVACPSFAVEVLSPYLPGWPVDYAFRNLPPAEGPVQLTLRQHYTVYGPRAQRLRTQVWLGDYGPLGNPWLGSFSSPLQTRVLSIPQHVFNHHVFAQSESPGDWEVRHRMSGVSGFAGGYLQLDYITGDCDGNGIADACDIANCPAGDDRCADDDGDGVLDVCENDCNNNGVPDRFEDPALDPELRDEDDNGVPDGCDSICEEDGDDCNGDGARDLCQERCNCRADLDRTGDIGHGDLVIVLANFGRIKTALRAGDINGDRRTNLEDLAIVLGAFGCCCE